MDIVSFLLGKPWLVQKDLGQLVQGMPVINRLSWKHKWQQTLEFQIAHASSLLDAQIAIGNCSASLYFCPDLL